MQPTTKIVTYIRIIMNPPLLDKDKGGPLIVEGSFYQEIVYMLKFSDFHLADKK